MTTKQLSANFTSKRTAKIYRPSKTAMQSGKAKTNKWLLEFDDQQPRKIDPIMGYTSVSDTQTQVKLSFESKESAIAYAERNDVNFRVIKDKQAKRRVVSYTDNFKYDRQQPWTH